MKRLAALILCLTALSGCRYDTSISLNFDKVNVSDDINRVHVWAIRVESSGAPQGFAVDLGEPAITGGTSLKFATGKNANTSDDLLVDHPVMFFAVGCEDSETSCVLATAEYFGCSDAIATPSADATDIQLTITLKDKTAGLAECEDSYGFTFAERIE